MNKKIFKKSLIVIFAAVICIIITNSPLRLFAAEENEKEDKTYSLLASEVPVGTYKTKTPVGTDGYFTLNGEAQSLDVSFNANTRNFIDKDGSTIAFNQSIKIPYTGTEYNKSKIEFTVSEGKYAQIVLFVGANDECAIGHYAIFRQNDDSIVEGSERYVFGIDRKYEIINNIEPGDYYISRTSKNECPLRFFRIDVQETDAPIVIGEKIPWDKVKNPTIEYATSYGQTENQIISIMYSMPIGADGADYVEATMYDSEGNVCGKGGSVLSDGTIYFNARNTDTYSFIIKAKRYSGEEKGGVNENGYDYVYDFRYSLYPSAIYLVYNSGGGIVNVDFKEVREATSYVVEYSSDGNEWEIGAIAKKNSAKIYGLEIGQTYYIRVKAKKENEEEVSESRIITVSDNYQVDWVNETFGPNIKKNVDVVVGNLNNNNTISINATGGKVAKAANDGMVTAYTKVKAEQNFTVSANIHVDSWTMNNEQNACGIFVSDANGVDTFGWNNILIAGEQQITYNKTDTNPGISHANGIGVTMKKGIDKDEVDIINVDNRYELGLSISQDTLEERYPNNTNIIGNWTNTGSAALDDGVNITDFKISVTKIGKNYSVTYESADGSYTNTKTYDFGDELLKIDEDSIYLGLFAARNTTATFTDVKYTILSEADYTEVDTAIAKANGLNRDAYVDFSGVDNAIGAVVRGYSADKQGFVDLMAKSINDAINALVLIPIVTVDDGGTTTTISSTSKISGGEKIEVTDNDDVLDSKITIKNEPGDDTVDSKIISGSEDELIDSMLTEKEKNNMKNGAHVSISLKIVNRGNEVSNVETKVIAKKLKTTTENKDVGAYIDITIEKTIGNKLVGVSETNSEITISIEVPKELANVINEDGKTYQIARNHDGIVDLLNAVYDKKTNHLTFTTDRFSTYAIIYSTCNSTEHVWTASVKEGLEGQLVSAATCTEPAIYKKYCTVCNALSDETFAHGNALGHSFHDGKCIRCKKDMPDDTPVREFIERLYSNILGRKSDENGIADWTKLLLDGSQNGVTVGYGFVFSDEFVNYGYTNEQKVDILYATFLNRLSDTEGKKVWVEALNSGVDLEKIYEGFVMSEEYAGICTSYGITQGQMSDIPGMDDTLGRYRNYNLGITGFVARCYTEALGRQYDIDGVEDWCRQIVTGSWTPRNVAAGFVHSEEFINKNTTTEEYVNVLYKTFLGRECDADGYNMWVGLINSGEWTRDQVMDGFAESTEFGGILAGFGLN